MIESTGTGGFIVECDYCDHSEFVDVEAFSWAVDRIKKDGWRVRKEGGEWTHVCPVCADGRVLKEGA